MGTERTLMILVRESLQSLGIFNGLVLYTLPDVYKLQAQFTQFSSNHQKSYAFLNDSNVNAVLHSSLYGIDEEYPDRQKSPDSQPKRLLIDDRTFEVELKQYIVRSRPIEPACVKYMKSFFCDNTISKTMRRWLWRERIGNKIKMNRTLFNAWLERSTSMGICPDQAATIKVDLIRACSCLRDSSDKVRIYADLEKLIWAFVVSHNFIQCYRPDIGYVQGMSSIMLQIYGVTGSEWFETFALFSNLLLTNHYFKSLYSFDYDMVEFYDLDL
jgi:Rab-GTPase-TBC domain